MWLEHRLIKFHLSWTTHSRVMTSYRFSKWRQRRSKSTSGFRFIVTWRLKKEKIYAYQISTKYLNPQRKYYYFRFLKTKDRRIEILLPVSILTYLPSSACDSASAYQISEVDDRRRSYDAISIFQDGGHGSGSGIFSKCLTPKWTIVARKHVVWAILCLFLSYSLCCILCELKYI